MILGNYLGGQGGLGKDRRGLVLTLGHSNRSIGELLEILKGLHVDLVVDVRRWASSRAFPWFSGDALKSVLRSHGIRYVHYPQLGGFRVFGRDVEDLGLFKCFKSEGFRAYATYVYVSREVNEILKSIATSALKGEVITLLCRERFPWRCHRKILADWLIEVGVNVVHVIDLNHLVRHEGTTCYKSGFRFGARLGNH